MKPKLGYLVLHPSLSLSDLTFTPFFEPSFPLFWRHPNSCSVWPCFRKLSRLAVLSEVLRQPLGKILNILRVYDLGWISHGIWGVEVQTIFQVTPSSIAHSRPATGSKDTLPLISLFYNWILHAANWLVHWVAPLLVNCGRLVWSSSTGTTRHCPSRSCFFWKVAEFESRKLSPEAGRPDLRYPWYPFEILVLAPFPTPSSHRKFRIGSSWMKQRLLPTSFLRDAMKIYPTRCSMSNHLSNHLSI